ncbi:MAG: hypothetical protein IPQ07_24520, partial [Myxococcales bacterium]|nr:hypothetical protein [Myxococcales bacterium]
MRHLGALVVILLAQACNSASPDTGGDDVGPDAAVAGDSAQPDGPQVGTVDVIVAGWPAPTYAPALFADVPVVFFKPDGTVGSVVRTDASGRASATIERGSLVAAINGANRADVQVDAAVANPGDTLRFGPDVGSSAVVGQLHVSWPARVVTGYTVYYTVVTPCGGMETTSTAATITLDQGCAPGPFDVVVTSRRSSQETTGIMSRRAVQPGANVTVNLADNAATWNIGGFTNIAVTNVPSGASAGCSAVQRLGTMGINGTSSSAFMGSCSMRLLPGSETTWDVDAAYSLDADPRFAVEVRQTSPHDTIAPVDFMDALPMISSLAYAPTTRELTWASAQP